MVEHSKCNGTGKLHPKINTTDKICFGCNWFWEECKGVCKCQESDWRNIKYLSVNEQNSKAMVIENV